MSAQGTVQTEPWEGVPVSTEGGNEDEPLDGAASSGQVAVIEHAGLVVLDGPQDVVDRLVAQDPVLCSRSPRPVEQSGAADALSALVALVGSSGTQQTVFQLDAAGMQMFQDGRLAKAGDGMYRLFGHAKDGTIAGHGALKPLATSSTQALSAQLALVTLSLTAAIKEVQAAVERVESHVEVLRDLVESQRTGDILGLHTRLVRRATAVGLEGSVSNTDWQGIDDEGYGTENTIASLRTYIRKRLRAAMDEGTRIGGRVEALEGVRDLSETLALLVVAQDNLFLFQQLRLVRIRDTEPERLGAAIDETRDLLSTQIKEDQEILDQVRLLLDERVSVDALEIHRFVAARSVGTLAAEIDEMLTWFAAQRALHYEPVLIPPVPGVSDALAEIRERGGDAAVEARRVLGTVAGRVRQRERGDPDRAAIDAGRGPAELDAGSPAPADDTRTSRVRGALSRVRPRLGVADRRDDEASEPS
jgi:hypothetical protein